VGRVGGSSLLRHGDFLKLWWGQAVSELGSGITMLALPLVAITTLHATAFQVGALNAVEMAPFLLIGLPAGTIVDWLRRRQVMVVADFGRMLALGSIPVTAAFGRLTLAQLYAVAVVAGTLTVLFDVAYQSYLPVLVPRAQLADGNSKLAATQQLANVSGPAIGGALVSAVGAATAIAADAASYLASVLSLLWIRRPEAAPTRDDELSRLRALRRDTAEGLRYVVRHRTLRMIAACTGSSNLANAMAGAVLVLYMVRKLHLSAAAIGAIFAVGSVAGVVSAVVAGRLLRLGGIGRMTVAGAFMFAVGGVFIPLATRGAGALWIVAGLTTVGFGGIVYNIGQVSYRQAITPDRLLGRMNATMRFMVWGTLPVGALIGGALGSAIGLRPTLWVAAALGLVSPFFVFASPLRRVRALPTEIEAAA